MDIRTTGQGNKNYKEYFLTKLIIQKYTDFISQLMVEIDIIANTCPPYTVYVANKLVFLGAIFPEW